MKSNVMSGLTSFHAGVAAEEIVARHYVANGYRLLEQRWRGPVGEIDLILSRDGTTVFVEVKKAKSIESAAARITSRQIIRVSQSAEGFLGGLPNGINSDARIDVAVVDGCGAVRVLENVTIH